MFNSLTGTVTEKSEQKIFLETHGIEWDIICPDMDIQALPEAGKSAKVYVWLQHTDALMNLYGFASSSSRQLFFDLLKVDGIGPKGAVKIMSSISAESLDSILESGSVEQLQKVPGVGKKTAAKMLLALKGRLSLQDTSSVSSKQTLSPYEDVIASFVSMGYERKSVESVVSKISQEKEKDSDFAKKTKSQKEDSIIKQAIVELAQ